MALNDYAYYNTSTGLIENVIWLDSDHLDDLLDFPPQGYAIVDIPPGGIQGEWSGAGIGWFYINGEFVEPPKPELIATEPQPISQGAQTL